MDLSIIIVSFNTKDILRNCLQSLFDVQSKPPRFRNGGSSTELEFEVIVVDNASKDGSVEMVKSKFLQVKLIENQTNLGFAKANNLGIKNSTGEFVFFLNSDTIVCNDALTRLVEFVQTQDQVGIVGPRLLNADGSLQRSCGRRLTPKLLFLAYFLSQEAWGYPENLYGQIFQPDAVSGAALLAKRKMLNQIGGWSEDFFMYGEDTDLCYRAKEAGWQTFYFPQSEIIHLGGQSTRLKKIEMDRAFAKSFWFLFKRHYSLPIAILMYSEVLIGLNFQRLLNSKQKIKSIFKGIRQKLFFTDGNPIDVRLRYLPAIQFIQKIPNWKSLSILEAGSGSEGIGKYLKHRIVGSDVVFDQALLDRNPYLDPIFSPSEKMPFADREFDLVLSVDMLEHIQPTERENALREMLRVAKRYLVVGCPTNQAVEKFDQPIRERELKKFGPSTWDSYRQEHLDYGVSSSRMIKETLERIEDERGEKFELKLRPHENIALSKIRWEIMTSKLVQKMPLNKLLYALVFFVYQFANLGVCYRTYFFLEKNSQ